MFNVSYMRAHVRDLQMSEGIQHPDSHLVRYAEKQKQ